MLGNRSSRWDFLNDLKIVFFGNFNFIENVNLKTNVRFCEAAARLERSSFFEK